MPKIILTLQYMRDAPPAQLENYVKYIGTREGVQKIDESKLLLPATVRQQHLIQQFVRDIPSAKEMLKYADYCESPTIGNATEFIALALEQNLNLMSKRENYVDYIAGRPRVERIGEHGLFTDAGVPVVLAQVQEDVCSHKGAVWTHVISLRREDAARLGYDSGRQWQDLLRSKKAMLCKHISYKELIGLFLKEIEIQTFALRVQRIMEDASDLGESGVSQMLFRNPEHI